MVLMHICSYVQVPSSQLIDPSREEADVRLWHDQLFAKPAKHGGVVAWYICMCSALTGMSLVTVYGKTFE